MQTPYRFWLWFQYLGLLTATTIAAGGGQFPGNLAGPILISIKFCLLLLPIVSLSILYLRHAENRAVICKTIHNNLFLVVFFISILISLPLSLYPLFSLQRYIYTLFGFSSLLCLACQYDLHDKNLYVRHSLWIIMILLTMLLTVGIFGPYNDLRSNIQNQHLVHPNMLSSLAAQLTLIALFTTAHYIKRSIAFIGLMIVILSLQSRGVWLSLSLAILIALGHACFEKTILWPRLLLAALLSGLIILTLICYLQPSVTQFLLDLVSRGENLEELLSLTNRTYLWQQLIHDMTLKQALVGYGYGLMSPTVGVDFGDGVLYGAHNGYLSLYLGTGIICLALFLLAWGQKLYQLYDRHAMLPKHIFYRVMTSFCILFIHAFSAEEFGLHITPTFVLLFLNTQAMYRQDNKP